MGQTGQLALGVVGAVIGGFATGGSPAGIMLGWSIGSGVGAILFPPKQKPQVGPRLADLSGVQGSAYGIPIPTYWGSMRLPGNVVWTHGLEEERTETSQGGKGTGKGQKIVNYKYYASWDSAFAVGDVFSDRSVGGGLIRRLWFDSKLVYNAGGPTTTAPGSVGDGTNDPIPGLVWRLYDGVSTAGPDPVIAQWEGANAPTHKGLVRAVFDRVPLEGVGNRIPMVSAEFIQNASWSTTPTDTIPLLEITHPFTGYTYTGPAVDSARGVGYVGAYNPDTNQAGFSTFDPATMQELTSVEYASLRTGLPADTVPVWTYVAPGGLLYVLEENQTTQHLSVAAFNPDTMTYIQTLEIPDNASASITDPMLRAALLATPANPQQAFLIIGDSTGTGTNRFVITDGTQAVLVDEVQATVPSASFTIPGGTYQLHSDIWHVETRPGSTHIFVSRYSVDYSVTTATVSASPTGTWDVDPATAFAAMPGWSGAASVGLVRTYYDPADNSLVFGFVDPAQTFVKWNPDTNLAVWDSALETEATLGWQPDQFPLSGYAAGGNYVGGLQAALNLSTGAITGPGAGAYTGDTTLGTPQISGLDAFIRIFGGSLQRTALYRLSDQPTDLGTVLSDSMAMLELGDAWGVGEGVGEIPIRGYAAARPWTAREIVEPLMNALSFDLSEIDGKLVFQLRGRDPVAVVTYADLVVANGESPIDQRITHDGDIARKVIVHHVNPEHNYDTSTQDFEIGVVQSIDSSGAITGRPVIGNAGEMNVDLTMALLPDEAKAVALSVLQRAWQERVTYTFTLPPKYIGLTENDPLVITLQNGATTRVRCTEITVGADWTLKTVAVSEAPLVFATD